MRAEDWHELETMIVSLKQELHDQDNVTRRLARSNRYGAKAARRASLARRQALEGQLGVLLVLRDRLLAVRPKEGAEP